MTDLELINKAWLKAYEFGFEAGHDVGDGAHTGVYSDETDMDEEWSKFKIENGLVD